MNVIAYNNRPAITATGLSNDSPNKPHVPAFALHVPGLELVHVPPALF